jgi:hypothetical protein
MINIYKMNKTDIESLVIICNTKTKSNYIAKFLKKNEFPAISLVIYEKIFSIQYFLIIKDY